MRDEFLITRQGKQFVLFAGLLDEAHAKHGLRSIETELIQVPSAENGDVAIVYAVVRTENGKFTGIGDASPENVGKNIVPHVIRMAETRAKARALRDAINVGATSLEELGPEEEEVSPRELLFRIVGKRVAEFEEKYGSIAGLTDAGAQQHVDRLLAAKTRPANG